MRCRMLLVGLLLCVAVVARADEPADKPRLKFDDQTLVLVFETNGTTETLKEYIPQDETLEHWTHLASVRSYDHLNDPRAVVDNIVKALKKQNPLARHKVFENPKTGEVMVDFVTWPEDSSFVEFNVFKYSKWSGGGLVAQQYALRAYGEEGHDFLRGLKPVRERLVELMATKGLAPAAKE